MKFSLRHGQRNIPLVDGEYLIGRDADCALSLDDPLVSRHHALVRIAGKIATIEDLGSRNGIEVNGRRVVSDCRLADGDRLRLGKQQLMFRAQSGEAEVARVEARTLPAFDRAEVYAALWGLADKSLALGRSQEAARILTPHLEQVLDDAEAGSQLDPRIIDRVTGYALTLAEASRDPLWVTYLFRLYGALELVCPSKVVDALYALLRQIDHVDRGGLSEYLERLRKRFDDLSPSERFLFGRLEGLDRLLR